MSPRRPPADVSNPASVESALHSPSLHQQNSISNPPQTAGKKRRASGSVSGGSGGGGGGSRGVANLTPEQLAKKRANDREAQRAIRERTKNTIESLEKKIQELTSQQPYQELQQAIQQKELAEAENADIKRRLSSALSILNPLLAGIGHYDGGSPYDTRAQYRPPIHTAIGREDTPSQTYSPSASSIAGPSALSGPYASRGWQSSTPVTSSRPSPLVHAENTPRGRRPDRNAEGGSLLRTTSAERQALGLLPLGRPEIQTTADHIDDGGRRSAALPADSHITLAAHNNSNNNSNNNNNRSPDPYQYNQTAPHNSVASYTTLPPFTPASCLLDGLLLDFINGRRRMAAEGASEEELAGPAYPDFYAFMHPAERHQSHGISKVFADIISTFPDLSAPPEKIATYYGMFLVMRWHVCPTQDNYERLPMWLRPTSWQILTPHPIWIDHLPWPEMREELVQHYHRYPFENFFVPFTKTMSVNWPHAPMDIFLPRQGQRDLRISPQFEAHMRDITNWSLGSSFKKQFPMLATGVTIVDHDDRHNS